MNQGNPDDRRSQQPSSLPLSLHASLLTPSQPSASPPEEPRETGDSPTHSDDSYESDSAHHQERQDQQDRQHAYDPLDRSHNPWLERTHSYPQATRTSGGQAAQAGRPRPITTPLPEDHARRSSQAVRDYPSTQYSLPGPSRLFTPRNPFQPGASTSYTDVPHVPVSYPYPTSSLTAPLPPLDRLGFPPRPYNEPGPSRYHDQEPNTLSSELDTSSGPRHLPSLVSQERSSIRGRPFAVATDPRRRAPEIVRSHSLPRDPRSSFDLRTSGAGDYDPSTHHRRNPLPIRREHPDASEPSFRPTPTPVSHVGDSERRLPPPTPFVRHEGGSGVTGRSPLLPPPIPPPPISSISSLSSVPSGEPLRQYSDSSEFPRAQPGVFRPELPRLDTRSRPPPLENPVQLPPLRAGFPISPEEPLMPLGTYDQLPPGPVELPPFSYGGELAPHVPHDEPPIAGPSRLGVSATILDPDPPSSAPARGRGSRGSRGARGGKRKRNTKPSVTESEKDENDGEESMVGDQAASQQDSKSEDDDDPSYDRPLRRAPKKVAIACDFCRGRKLKCNGVRPQCSNCARRERPCSYVPYQRRRGPGKKPQKSSVHGSTHDTGSQHLLGEPSTARSTAPGSPNPPPPPPSSSAPESSLSPPAGPVPMMPTEYVFSSTYPPLGLTPLQREEARRRRAGERPLGGSSIASSSRDTGEEEGGPSSMDFEEYIREDYAEAKPPPRPPEGRKR